ncbi:MAG: hypothetical protein V2A56_03930 [bacterium]
MVRTRTLTATLLLVMTAALLLSAPPAEAKHPKQGYIYGKVTTRTNNVYTGLLRWDDEEAFWDDLFHSYKETRPYTEYLEKMGDSKRGNLRDLDHELGRLAREEEQLAKEEERLAKLEARTKDEDTRQKYSERRSEKASERYRVSSERAGLERDAARVKIAEAGRKISVLGGAININVGGWTGSRIFIARFGDIQKITVIGSEDAELLMKSGTTYTVSGYSNDVGGTIRVRDNSIGDISLDWRKIDTIEFMETPKSVNPAGYRLSGTVTADGADYKGYIQWDSEECLSTDKLDGESDDGKLAIDFGNIRSIERRSRSSSWVVLKDGRKLSLEGTNDVDGSIRGIMVEDERYGRLKVPWDAFEKAVFNDEGESGRAYSDFSKERRLEGTVTDTDGTTYTGKFVFDLDEGETWEILNGDFFDIEFNIPFIRIKEIRPRSRSSCTVVLDNGESLRLEGGQDVSQANDGILIFGKGDKEDPTYIPWEQVELITLK